MAKKKSKFLSGKRIDPKPIDNQMSLADLVDESFMAYNAARIREACRLFTQKMLDEDVTVGVDRDEHDGTWSIPHDPFILARAVADPALTPVARAVLLLGGRHHFGPDWFAAARLDHAALVSA